MSTLEKVVYFFTALTLYTIVLVTAVSVPSTTLEIVAIVISFLEAIHWVGLRHKRIGMFFWGLLVWIATLMLLIKVSANV
jgi:hypothetical protein